MTEADFIAAEQAKWNATRRRVLKKVDRTGWAGRNAIESLLSMGLIRFGGPRPEINHPYNCYRLTEAGHDQLCSAGKLQG